MNIIIVSSYEIFRCRSDITIHHSQYYIDTKLYYYIYNLLYGKYLVILYIKLYNIVMIIIIVIQLKLHYML